MAIRLTQEHQQRLFRHIREKWGERHECPMCHGHKWSVDASIYRLAALSTDPTSPHNVVQPLATVRCTNCSFVALIHLTQAGIATADELRLGVPQAPVTVPHVPASPIEVPTFLHGGDGDVDANDDTH